MLTEDVRFLDADDRDARARQRARAWSPPSRARSPRLRPDLEQAELAKPLTMLLFGMINWMFTWLRPAGELDHDAMAPIVADLFLGGLRRRSPRAGHRA